jgi:hypothetical protein
VSGGRSHLGTGGDTEIGKQASAGFFLLIGGGEREGVVPVPYIGDGWPTACRSGGNMAEHCSPVPGQARTQCGRFEADLGHYSTGPGQNH